VARELLYQIMSNWGDLCLAVEAKEMKRVNLMTLSAALLLVLATGAYAQDFGPGNGTGTGECQFIDEDGDGFNDLAPDADGDGIPNGLDPDYVKPADGTGNQFKWAHAYGELFRRVFGEDVLMAMKGDGTGHYGPGDGTGDCIGDGIGGGAFGPGAGNTGGVGGGTGEGSDGESGVGTRDRRGGRR